MRLRCILCRDPSRPGAFKEFEGDEGDPCPHCGAGEGAVFALADVHFLVKDPAGPIVGQYGERYRVCCDRKREVLAEHEEDSYAASGDPRAVTCPSCKGAERWRQMMGAFADGRRALRLIERGDCCGEQRDESGKKKKGG